MLIKILNIFSLYILILQGEIEIAVYNIAGLKIEYTGFTDKGIQKDMEPYIYAGNLRPDIMVKSSLCDNIEPCFKPYTADQYRLWGNMEDKTVFYDYDRQRDICYMQVVADKNWKNICAEFYDIKKLLGACDDYFAFNAMRDIFAFICLKNNGLVLHSSAISFDRSGIAFSAHSGVGKSTHTSLWKNMFPDRVQILNDDTPAIMYKDGQAVVCGTPFCGTSGVNTADSVPLKAIVFLQRSTSNSIEQMDSVSAVKHILEQVKRPPVSDLMENTLSMIDILVKSVPVYRLSCNISEDAVRVVKEQLDL